MTNKVVLTICAILATGAAPNDLASRLGWDDTYRTVIAGVERHSPAETAREKIHLLELAAVSSPKNPLRAKVWEGVGSVTDQVVSSVRLEYGNANRGSYGVVWIIETPSAVLLFTHRDPARSVRVDRKEYLRLWDELRRHKAWELESDADLFFDDATTYFLSLSSSGRTHQAAIYAPPSDGRTAAQRGLRPSADEFAMVIAAVHGFGDR